MRVLEIHSLANSLSEILPYLNYFDYFYLMGIYKPTDFSKSLNQKYGNDSSLFSIISYHHYNDKAMMLYFKLIKLISKQKIIIDFIPNHLGITKKNYQYGFSDKRWGNWEWADTIQLDYTKQETLDYLISEIQLLAPNVGGFRFDMTHLVLRKNYEQKHNVKLNYEPLEILVKEAKKINPNLIFIAEAYQDYEELKNLGFFVYRVEPRRNQVVTIDCGREIVVIDNHDEKLLYWENNQNLFNLKSQLSSLSQHVNTLWYLPAILGYLTRPSANFYLRKFATSNSLAQIYFTQLLNLSVYNPFRRNYE